jgi:hypothetical protein
VVSSISYCDRYGSSLPAIGRCFTSWCNITSSFVPHTGSRVTLPLLTIIERKVEKKKTSWIVYSMLFQKKKKKEKEIIERKVSV